MKEKREFKKIVTIDVELINQRLQFSCWKGTIVLIKEFGERPVD